MEKLQEETKTPTRSEISESDTWDLSHLYPDTAGWQADFDWLQQNYSRINEWKGKLNESADSLASCLEFEKELDLKLERLYHFASLQLAEDSANNEYLSRISELQNLLTSIGEAFAFLVPEIQAIDDKKWSEFLQSEALTDWRISLQKIRRLRPHVLSEPEERLLALGAAALSGFDDAFSQLTNVDMKFGVLRDETGKERPLTQSTYSSFLLRRDRDVRERAFTQFYAEFRDHQYTLAAALSYSVKADVFRARARHYSSALEASLFQDDVPVSVYYGLIQTVRSGVPIIFRYY